MEPDHRDQRCNRPSAFNKMEALMREMQDADTGVPIRSQKLFLTSIPAACVGYDLIEWIMLRYSLHESEALSIANQLCHYGYLIPVSDSKNLVVRDDSSLYRFQSPYYWPLQNRPPDNVEYAIYLAKRTLRNKQKHGLEEYELEALSNLRKNLANKWEFIMMQADEQVKLIKLLKKGEKAIADSQERAYWRIHRPPPGMVSSLEQCPVPTRSWNGSKTRKRTIEDYRRELELLRNSLSRTRIKMSQALESILQHVETYSEYDPMITATYPSNPWVTDEPTYWLQNGPLVEIPTEKRVRRWALSMEELLSDPTGIQEFTNYLRKEYSHENIRFWSAVNDLRRSAQSQIARKVHDIFEEFLAPGAPCEINIDGKTMEKVHQEMKNPSRFTFDSAQEHVYTLLLKKDCYPRFIRSEYYKNLLATAIQPSQKKRFGFTFGQTKKKASTSCAPNQQLLQQQPSQSTTVTCGALTKRRGSDRSLSGSAHELAISGVKDPKVPHSHSQSNLSDIPYRGDLACLPKANPIAATVSSPVKKPSIAVAAGTSTSEDVCPWETTTESRSRRDSIQLDSGSSSSDISVAMTTEIPEKTIQRTNILTQQHTLDGGRKLSAISTNIDQPRRASVSVPITHSTNDSAKRKVSSFEDSMMVTTSVATTTITSTPVTITTITTLTTTTTTATNKPFSSSVIVIPSDIDNNKDEDCTSTISKTLIKSHSLAAAKTLAVSGTNTPTISVSSVADDSTTTDNIKIMETENVQLVIENDSIAVARSSSIDKPSCSQTPSGSLHQQLQLQQPEPLAPLAEPDSESPASEFPPTDDIVSGETERIDGEAKNNDVCPWEDEETCKVDTPFVKTYATLGYL